jgi:hypothetical protein
MKPPESHTEAASGSGRIHGSAAGPSREFGADYDRAVRSLQVALGALVAAADGDSTKPQDLSRSFKLDKNLTWKVSRLIHAEDALFALRFLPGPGGLKILDQGLGGPAGEPARAAFRAAVSEFEAMVERHAGDRATLEMLVQGLDHARSLGAVSEIQSLQRARREAFRGNAAVWGVQAAALVTTIAIAPNAEDPAFADVVEAKGLIDFRRTRGDARWQLFSRQSWRSDPEAPFAAGGRALRDGPEGSKQVPLLPEFCSSPLPVVEILETEGWTRYELPPGPVGNTNLETIVYGVYLERMGEVADPDPDATVEIGSQCTTPTELMQVDLLLHRGLGWGAPESAQLYGMLDGRSPFHRQGREGRALPLEVEIESLGTGLGQLDAEGVPRSAELAAFLLERAGWDPADFEVYRVSVPHPPMPTSLLLSTRLPSP